jgi:hypothetical protein
MLGTLSRRNAELFVMLRRKPLPEPRDVYIDRVNGWVRSVNSKGKELRFMATDDPHELEILAWAYRAELDAVDPVDEPPDPTPQRPSTADLRHLRLL